MQVRSEGCLVLERSLRLSLSHFFSSTKQCWGTPWGSWLAMVLMDIPSSSLSNPLPRSSHCPSDWCQDIVISKNIDAPFQYFKCTLVEVELVQHYSGSQNSVKLSSSNSDHILSKIGITKTFGTYCTLWMTSTHNGRTFENVASSLSKYHFQGAFWQWQHCSKLRCYKDQARSTVPWRYSGDVR